MKRLLRLRTTCHCGLHTTTTHHHHKILTSPIISNFNKNQNFPFKLHNNNNNSNGHNLTQLRHFSTTTTHLNHNHNHNNNNEKSIEQIYQKKTPIQHVLERPDTYVGSVDRFTRPSFILVPACPSSKSLKSKNAKNAKNEVKNEKNEVKNAKNEKNEQQVMKMMIQHKNISYVPALYKIIDELLVNAVDNHNRSGTLTNEVRISFEGHLLRSRKNEKNDKNQKMHQKFEKTNKNDENGENDIDFCVRVWNNGKSIPVQVHKTEKIYVPELVFGHLLTGSNFDDSETKFTGGRNGYGAKLANIFSREFIVEINDVVHQCRYRQQWTQNMSECTEPMIVDTAVNKRTKKVKKSDDDDETNSVVDFGTVGVGGGVDDKQGWIQITVRPDLSKFAPFETEEQEEDFLNLLRRRVYDLAACNPKLKVYLNGERVQISNFQDYIKLFYVNNGDHDGGIESDVSSDNGGNGGSDAFVYKKINSNLELALGPSIVHHHHHHHTSKSSSHHHDTNEFVHFSFVNSIATSNGGTHISHLSSVIARKILDHVKKHPLFKEHEMKSASSSSSSSTNSTSANSTGGGHSSSDTQFLRLILSQISLFANCLIENPSFDSQTKETLTTKSFQFMNKHFMVHSGAENEKKVDDLVKQFVQRTNIVEEILSTALFRQQRRMRNKTGSTRQVASRLMIPKLDDANLAGGAQSHKCTLILTEGDSAKALAVAGLSVIGRDTYGIYPLRGKMMNVRDASVDQIANNAEIANLKKILGLENYVDSDNVSGTVTKGLRYGRVMLMCDQDHDGSHIKGLFINFLHYFYPNLLRSGFVEEFITPIMKATKQKNTIAFFSVAEYEKWRNNLIETSGVNEANRWSIKYYKGLGTSTSNEAKEYFSKLNEKHRIVFEFDEERTADDELIEMVFHKSNAQKRKEWLSKYRLLSESEGDQFIDHSHGRVTLSNFFNKEFVHFSQYDNVRSIPSLVDGLKPSQRKVLYAIMNKRNLINDEIKVAQLAGYVSEKTAYHHGEASLNSTIINMAQDFVGSGNNIPLLFPSGQFGTRLQGGRDAASARYVFTRLNALTRKIFPEADDPILEYNEEDGMQIEPKFFVPIIPMILVNGAEGVGTGWSTSVPTFHPLDLIQYLKNKILGKRRGKSIHIWTRNFTGEFSYDPEKNRYSTFGRIELQMPKKKTDKDYVISITELPLGKWTEDYKAFLIGQTSSDDGMVKKFSEHHTDVTVRFDAVLRPEYFPNGLEDIKQGIDDKSLHKSLKLESSVSLSNMTMFDPSGHIAQYTSVHEIIEQFYPTRVLFYQKRKQFLLDQYESELRLLSNKLKFLEHFTMNERTSPNPISSFASKKRDEMVSYLRDELGLAPINDSFQYVLNLPLYNLTVENVEKLKRQVGEKQRQFDELSAKSEQQLWIDDLTALEETLVAQKENYCL